MTYFTIHYGNNIYLNKCHHHCILRCHLDMYLLPLQYQQYFHPRCCTLIKWKGGNSYWIKGIKCTRQYCQVRRVYWKCVIYLWLNNHILQVDIQKSKGLFLSPLLCLQCRRKLFHHMIHSYRRNTLLSRNLRQNWFLCLLVSNLIVCLHQDMLAGSKEHRRLKF